MRARKRAKKVNMLSEGCPLCVTISAIVGGEGGGQKRQVIYNSSLNILKESGKLQ